MTKRYQKLAKNFKFFRGRLDAMYSSRVVKLLFNRFIKKGKKHFSYNQLLLAFARLRTYYQNISLFRLLIYLVRTLRIQFFFRQRRQGQVFITVPLIIRRNRFLRWSIRFIASAIKDSKERRFCDRVFREFWLSLLYPSQSHIMNRYYTHLKTVYTERVFFQKRWK
jgi:ribosomal protein S7